MATLDRWRPFLDYPQTINFPHLELIGHDDAPPIIVGAGEVRVISPNEFAYTVTGIPTDIPYIFKEINRQRDNPYDALARFRLTGTDAHGIAWSGGWTIPRVAHGSTNWTFTGDIDSLVTDDHTPTVASHASTELIFLLRIGDPMTIAMARYARSAEGKRPEGRMLDILGSSIRFTFEDVTSTLSITATHSCDLPCTYVENWLSEPLRILFGQLIFPRLVARNYGDGRSTVWVRPSPSLIQEARWIALWTGDNAFHSDDAFWSCFADILTLIAHTRDKDGHLGFEAHKLTQLYEQLVLASRGSRWVWALTFASGIEAIIQMMVPRGTKAVDADLEAIEAFVKYVKDGPGDMRLKNAAINALRRTAEITTTRAMRDLGTAGVITTEQVSAWRAIRNAVMHGSLVSPYSTEQDDGRILALASMMRALTRELLHRSHSLITPENVS
jgi:hypothetical protein